MNQNPDLNNLFPYFRKSMNYLMNEGEIFAKQYPTVAKELNFSANKTSDPHVSRLLESFALFDARLQYQLQDQMSELSYHILNALYPQLVAPIPSCTVVQMNKMPNISHKSKLTIDKGTQIQTINKENVQCTFQTTSNVEFSNTQIHNITYIKADQTNVKTQNTFLLGIEVKKLTDKSLTFFINSDLFSSFSLYENIMAYDPYSPTPVFITDLKNNTVSHTPIGYIKLKGFSKDDALFDLPKYTKDIHRYLLEYSAFPEKFLFFTIEFTEDVDYDHAKLVIPLSDKCNPNTTQLHNDMLCLNCVPAINIFQKKSEPITMEYESETYKLIPSQDEDNFEVHSVESVYEYNPESPTGISEYAPYFNFHKMESDKFWYTTQSHSYLGGSNTFISFVNTQMDLLTLDTSTIFADLTCTNRLAATHIEVNSKFDIPQLDGIYCTNIIKPTEPTYPSQTGKANWNIISNLALNHIDVAINDSDISTFHKMLQIYSLRRDITQYSNAILKIDFEESITRDHNITLNALPKTIFNMTLQDNMPETFLLSTVLSHVLLGTIPFNHVLEVVLHKNTNPGKVWKSIELRI